MFLSVKEMELRKIRFDETFEPGQIDFSGEEIWSRVLRLQAAGVAELLAHSEGRFGSRGGTPWK